MLRNCLSALLNSLSFNYSEEKDSRKIKRQKIVSRSRTLRFEPCEDRTMLSVSPFNSEDVTAHWTFDVNTEDTNGAFVGTLNNGASLTTNGIAGGGLSLDGVDDYFSIGDPEELQIINEITLSAWIIPESASGTQNIIAKGYSTHPNGEIFLRIANGKYQVGSWTGSEHLAEFVIPSSDIGERVHLAGTYDGTTWRLYRNGVEIASTVDNTGAVEVDGAWAVGARGTGTERFYSGVIDEVVISSTAYTAQEIAALASIPTNAQEDNSVTWNWSDVQSGELYSEQGDSLGTLSNGAVVQFDSAYGQVLNLSGNNGYVSLGNPDDLQIHGEITLSAWICPNSFTGIQNIIAKGHSSNPNGEIFLRIANGEYQVGSWNGTNYYASAIADTDDIGQWIQLTGVYDGTAWRLYKNGVLAASLSTTVGAVPVSADWSIGSNGSGSTRFFNGKIGNGGIYDHALDAQSVAALMTDSQTTARVGGNSYAIKDQSYVLQLEASNPDVIWTINWGDGTTEDYYNASSASHVYTHYGTSGVSVTAKRNGQTIDVAGSSISLQIGSVDEMIINGNFEDVAIPNGAYWAIYDTIPGWTGPVEIQINNGSKVAELDTDSRYSDLDPSESDHQPHHTSISSSPLFFTPGLTYTLSFDAWNRSDYAQDNILNVTVPGEIISVNGNTSVSTLLDLIDEDDLGAYSYTSISYNSVTFSAGGSYYETDDGNGGTVYTLGASPFHVSSITFVATSNSGSVSFSDVSSDVIPGYGPLLDNISMNQEYLYVDIDVDSNNDGVIDAFDDSIEMGNSQNTSIESGAYGYIVLAGEQFSIDLNTISSRLLDSSIYGVRLLDSEGILDFTDPNLYQSTATITAEQTGQTTLAYEIYLRDTNQVVARDEVLITVVDCEASITVSEEYIFENLEGCESTNFIISLNQEQVIPVWVDFNLSGEAEYASDYSILWDDYFEFDEQTMSGRVLFNPGEIDKSFTLFAIDDTPDFDSPYEIDWSGYQEEIESIICELAEGQYYYLPDAIIFDELELEGEPELYTISEEDNKSAFTQAKVVDLWCNINVDSNNDGIIDDPVLNPPPQGGDDIIEDKLIKLDGKPGGLLVNGSDYFLVRMSNFFANGSNNDFKIETLACKIISSNETVIPSRSSFFSVLENQCVLSTNNVNETTQVTLSYQIYELFNGVQNSGKVLFEDNVIVTVMPNNKYVNLIIDSNNNSGLGLSNINDANDEKYESHPNALGKFIPLYNDNENGTTNPDPLDISKMVPLKVEIPPYVNLNETKIQFIYDIPGVEKCIELYYQSDFGTIYTIDSSPIDYLELFGDKRNVTLYIKGVKAGRNTASFYDFNERIRDTRTIKVKLFSTVDATIDAFDTVQYIVGKKQSFIHELIFNTSLRSALVSQAIYNFQDLGKYGLQILDRTEIQTIFNNQSTISDVVLGYMDTLLKIKVTNLAASIRTALYRDYSYEAIDIAPSNSSNVSVINYNVANSVEYLFAFQGTEPEKLGHWITNVSQASGFANDSYNLAADIGKAFAQSNIPVRFVGHSLGGGLASAAAAASIGIRTIEAITFNAAGLHSNYSLITFPSNLTNVYAISVSGCILTNIQSRFSTIIPEAAGIKITTNGLNSQYNDLNNNPAYIHDLEIENNISLTAFNRKLEAIFGMLNLDEITKGISCHGMSQVIFGILNNVGVVYGYNNQDQDGIYKGHILKG